MISYMKSECYRTLRGKGFYIALAVINALVLLMNIALAVVDTGGKYGIFRFSLNMLTAQPIWMLVLGACLPGVLFIEDRKNGVMKNAVAYGISRVNLLVGKCILAFAFTFFTLCITMVVYVGSAWLLLDHPQWEPLREMLTAVGATLPAAAGSLIFTVVLGGILKNDMLVVLWWYVVFYGIPTVTFLLGLRIEFFDRIAKWMPYNFLRLEVQVTYDTYRCLWDTPEGLVRCILAGLASIVFAGAFGIWRFRKLEL